MQLFDNFDNIPQNYIPNNMFPRIPEIMVALDNDTVKPLFRDGRQVGYKWNWGDVIKLPIKNEIHIKVPNGSLTTNTPDEVPTTETVGDFIGQKFYNFKDFRSWTLKEILEEEIQPYYEGEEQETTGEVVYTYVWEEDPMFTYSKNIGQDYTLPLPWNEHD